MLLTVPGGGDSLHPAEAVLYALTAGALASSSGRGSAAGGGGGGGGGAAQPAPASADQAAPLAYALAVSGVAAAREPPPLLVLVVTKYLRAVLEAAASSVSELSLRAQPQGSAPKGLPHLWVRAINAMHLLAALLARPEMGRDAWRRALLPPLIRPMLALLRPAGDVLAVDACAVGRLATVRAMLVVMPQLLQSQPQPSSLPRLEPQQQQPGTTSPRQLPPLPDSAPQEVDAPPMDG